jgi:pimeloyl-ACP methyl ester carboxylesterase
MTVPLLETARLREGVVELPEVGLQFVECGAGPCVVLLHGYTDSWRSFRLVLPLLAPHCRCLALDLRGHGASVCPDGDFSLDAFAADAAGFLDQLGVGPVTLVGHSMGSFVARRVALDHPGLVERLVLVGSAIRVDNPVVRELQSQVRQMKTGVPRAFIEEFQTSCVADRGLVPAWFFDECVAAGTRVPLRVWRAALDGMLADDDSGRLGAIACPALVLGGREDSVFSVWEQAQLALAVPRGRLLLYDGVGHSPQWERPARFADDVLRFLAS